MVSVYKEWHANLNHLPRLSRYTLGERIDSLFGDLLELTLKAGYSPKENKLAIINQAAIKLDALKFFLQIAWEMKVIDTKKYSRLAEPLVEIGKMLGGWRKHFIKETPLA